MTYGVVSMRERERGEKKRASREVLFHAADRPSLTSSEGRAPGFAGCFVSKSLILGFVYLGMPGIGELSMQAMNP